MSRTCPTCSLPIPAGTRARFCPHCSLRGALELAEEDAAPPIEDTTIIGDYELLEVIGRGGMGVVYRARQLSLNRPVAIKILLAGEFADEGARKRFHAEATAAARLRHPNIITIYEIGEHEGRAFFSMELVEGQTFADLARDGFIPPDTAGRLLKTVSEAVAFAHQRGILHRDLKPSNLLLDANGQPRISDFGLARQINVSDRLTLTGEVLGSPSYLSPEQARGQREQEGIGSDVYSLGAVLYHLLTGRPPFLGSSPQAILRAVIEDAPLSPSMLNPSVPLDLETICLKCLEKDPARRYSGAQELAEELERFLTRVPLKARPVGWLGQAWRWSLRHPARAAFAVAVFITLLTVAIFPTIAYVRISRAEEAQAHQYRETLLSQARAMRLGGNPGQRRESWPSLMKAANSGDADFRFRLKAEAIANLALDDAWFEIDTNLPPGDGTLLRFDPQQQVYAVGSFRGGIEIKEAANHRLIEKLPLTNQTLQHVLDFSPNQKLLAVRHHDKIAIRELAGDRVIVAEEAGINQFKFLNNSQYALFLKPDRVIALDVTSGKAAWDRSVEKSSGLRTLEVSRDDRRLAVSSAIGVQIYDLESTNSRTVPAPVQISALHWSFGNHLLAAGGHDGSIRLFDVASPNGQTALRTFETHGASIHALAFSPNDRWLAVAGSDETIRLIDVRGGRMSMTFNGRAYRLNFSPDGQRVGPIWKAGRPGWIYITNSSVFKMTRFQSPASSPLLAIDPVGEKCAVGAANEVLVFNADFAGATTRIPFANPRAAYFLQDGAMMAVSYAETKSWPPHSAFFAPSLGGETVSFSKDFKIAALANYPGNSVDISKGGNLMRRLAHERVCCAAMHPDGGEVVSTSIDLGETILWNVDSGAKIRTWPDEGANRAIFSPDGKWLAQIGPRSFIWNTTTWQKSQLLEDVPANSETADAVFSSNGKQLAIIMADLEIHLLSAPEFKSSAVLKAPSNARLRRLAWSQDGRRLAVLAAQNEVQLWDLPALRNGLSQIGADLE